MHNRQLKVHKNFLNLNDLSLTPLNNFNKYSINMVKYTADQNNTNMSQACQFNDMHV